MVQLLTLAMAYMTDDMYVVYGTWHRSTHGLFTQNGVRGNVWQYQVVMKMEGSGSSLAQLLALLY